jgi:hypothetical protein
MRFRSFVIGVGWGRELNNVNSGNLLIQTKIGK